MRPEVVIFDLGNVISIVDEWAPASILSQQLGISADCVFEAVFAPGSKRPLEKGGQDWWQFAAACSDRLGKPIPEPILRKAYLSVLNPDPTIFPVIEVLMARVPVGICSNTSRIQWEAERDKLPMAERLSQIVLSYEVGSLKPDPLVYREIVRRALVSPEHILFIDDTVANVKGARREGLISVEYRGVSPLVAFLNPVGLA